MHTSRPLEDIYQTVVDIADRGRSCVLAVVLEAGGSTPGKMGSNAIFDAEGGVWGTIGGGLVEREAQRRATEIIETGRPVILDFDLKNRQAGNGGSVCGGVMSVLLDPAAGRHREAYASAAAIRRERRRGVLITRIRGGKDLEVTVECLEEEGISSSVGPPDEDRIRSALSRETPLCFREDTPVECESLRVLYEPLLPGPALLIVGGGHVGQAVAAQASLVGFEITVLDDRPTFARGELFPAGTRIYCGDIGEEMSGLTLDAATYIVIATHGHKLDAETLAACIHEKAAYIGLIGSRRKVKMIRNWLCESGQAAAADLDRVYSPIGLDIGAVTAPEIAASIVAQLIAVRREGSAPRISHG